MLLLLFSGNPSPISSAAAINNAISRFSAELKAKYRCSRIKSDKWPPTPSKEYVKLTVVEYHSTYREDYIARVLKGKINKVPKAQDLTEEQILDLCVKQVGKGKVIVIEGAPGIGKSTLAWELCRKWEECSKMKAYSLVILLRASEKRVQNISGVSSLFYAYDRADRTSLVEEIRNHQGSGVMFVLDGFDELPRSLQHEGILADLLQKNVLSKSTVLITTRSSAMDRLLTISEPVIEKHIVILGFSQESMEAYASNAFSCTDELKRFRDYISGSPAIDSLMYVPLYAAFIVMIYKSTTSRKTLPRTITQLYTQLCLTILNRYMKTGSKYSSVRISSLESIPCEFREQFLELSKLAYESFIMEVVSFYSDISEHFGFLDAVPDLYGGCNVSFNFLHLTLQEFFAAYHITNMSDSGVELFNIRGKEERWNVVWRFVAGLKGFKFLDASTDATCLMQDRQLSLFFIQCLFEAQSVKLDFQSTFGFRAMQCALELCTSLDYYTLGYCIANCTTAESSWELTLYLPLVCSVSAFTQGLMSCNFSSGVISSLYIFCQFQPDVLGFLQECVSAATSPLHRVTQFGIFAADLTSNKEKTCLYELISHMPHLHTLGISFSRFSSLQGSPLIYYPCRDTDGLLKLLHCLPHSKVTSLNCIDSGLEYFLEESPLAQDYCTAFQALINPPSNIKVLFIGDSSFLNFNYCRAGNQTLCSLVSSSSSLKTLTLGLTHDCSFLNAFNSNKHLTKLAIVHVDLQWPRFSLAGEKWTKLVPGILKILQRCTGLEVLTLKLFDNSPKDKNVLRTIANALQRSKSLKSLQVEVLEGDRQLEKTLQAIDQRISVKDGLEEIYFGLLS